MLMKTTKCETYSGLFAGAVLSDETIQTFRCLFSTFRACMSGKTPISIVTDQDGAMRAAIEQEFPDATHMNCLFHIMSKAEILLGTALSGNPKFDVDFYVIVYNCLVLVDLSQENYICICGRFQKDGILCVHILRTLIHVDVGANLTIHNVIVLMQITLDLVPT